MNQALLRLFAIIALLAASTARMTAAAQTGIPDAGVSITFSHGPGFYTEGFFLEIQAGNPDARIHYTRDGSVPDLQSRQFRDPIRIDSRRGEPNVLSMIDRTSHGYATWAPPVGEVFKATVIRARAFVGGEPVGNVVTRTFFVEPGMQDRYRIPVISLVTDSLHLFDHETGIYVLGKIYEEWRFRNPHANLTGGTPANYHGRGVEWERPVHIEFFEPGGRLGFSQDAGMRMHGSWARAFRQKSIRLYSRSDYGTSRFRYRIFPDGDLDNFNRLILRNSGQDWTKTMLRDAMMQRLVAHLDVDTQAYRPAVVFINGEFWGIHNLRERYDRHYLETRYGAHRDSVDILTGNRQVKNGSDDHYRDMLDYIETHGVREAGHLAGVASMMDVENFRDYNIAQIYYNNLDWPHNNIDFWRYRADAYDPGAPYGLDGRWRWKIFDADFGFGWTRVWDAYRFNAVAWATDPGGNGRGGWATFLLRSLLENESFRTDFLNRFSDLLNTAFREDRVLNVIHDTKSAIEPHMQEHLDRWGYHEDRWETPRNLAEWEQNLDVLRHFASERPGHLRNHLRSQFSLGRSVSLTVDVSRPGAGIVRVNSVLIDRDTPGVGESPYPWTGIYFEGLPVTISAEPRTGYRFAGWKELPDAAGDSLTVSLERSTTLTAVFEETDFDPDGPEAHRLADGPYVFEAWHPEAPAGTYPPNMLFYYMDAVEPGLDARPAGVTTGAYDLESRTRMVGLGDGGFGFINTSNLDGNPGYPGRRLGAAALALDTRGTENIDVTWTGGTVIPNSRAYNLRLQYRIGDGGPLRDVPGEDGRPVEYAWSETAGHAESIGPIRLPEHAGNHPYIQLWWRYYFTGGRIDEDGGARSLMRVGSIGVTGTPATSAPDDPRPSSFFLDRNYPNPFNPATRITYGLAEASHVTLRVYSADGRLVRTLVDARQAPGVYDAVFDASGLASGVYLYRLEAGSNTAAGVMVLLR